MSHESRAVSENDRLVVHARDSFADFFRRDGGRSVNTAAVNTAAVTDGCASTV